ncbi:MAG: mannitol dehydrogenase family protein [Acidimicrobiales bacterium]
MMPPDPGPSASERLSLAALAFLDREALPPYDPAGLTVGIVHFGIGAFHRAHEAVYTSESVPASGTGWGICGVTQRSPRVASDLRPQDCLFSVTELGPGHKSIRVIGSVRDVLVAKEQAVELRELVALPTTRIVSLTVTEKGYHYDRSSRCLRLTDPEIRADLAAGGSLPAKSVVGQLVHCLEQRRMSDAGPISVLSCDNLLDNGKTLRSMVDDFCQAMPRGGTVLHDWVTGNVTFPNTVVDRIVPASTDADRAAVRCRLGVDDAAAVVAEPYRQWIIEDAFAAGRPRWEVSGAVLTSDVGPHQLLKLRVLNGLHSAIAYIASLADVTYIAEAIDEPDFRSYASLFIERDVLPTLGASDQVDLVRYGEIVCDRFSNPAVAHTTRQVAADGSEKLPDRLLGTIRSRRASGADPVFACLAVAAWMQVVTARASDSGRALPVEDPLAGRILALVEHETDAERIVDRLLDLHGVFGEDLPGDGRFRELMTELLGGIKSFGARTVLRSVCGFERRMTGA